MNLIRMFEMQKELDDYIVKTKGLEGQDLLPNTILALIVELGECCNEWRGFKHWSEDKEPRTEKLLVEFVDCLHFILSIGNRIGYDFEDARYLHDHNVQIYKNYNGDFIGHFITLFQEIGRLSDEPDDYEQYEEVFLFFLSLGEMFGFTWEQIEQAYTDKWNINKQRQTNGY